MNNADYVRAGLNRASAEGLFNDKNLRTLKKNEKFLVDTLNRAQNDGVLHEEEPQKTKYFQNICNFVLETSSFLFKEALQDFSKKYPLEGPDFYKKIWLANQEIGLEKKFIISTKDLYIVCNSAKYFDMHFEKSAYDLINGNCEQVVYEAVFELAKENGFLVEEDSTPNSRSAILQCIPNAENLLSALKEQTIQSVIDYVKNSSIPHLRSNVWNGITATQLTLNQEQIAVVDMINDKLRENNFRILTDDSGQYFLHCIDNSLNFECKSEQDVQNILQQNQLDGSVLARLAFLCQNELFDKVLSEAVNVVVDAIKGIRLCDKDLDIQKIDSKLPIYEVLFVDLKEKGFTVTDKGSHFVLTW